MKTVLLLLILGLMSMSVVAQSSYATVEGKYRSAVENKVFLFHVVDGDLVEYASTSLGKDGTFAFTLVPGKSNFYYLGTRKDYYRVYLQPEQVLRVDIDTEKGTIVLEGKNSQENMLVNEWQHLIREVEVKATKMAGAYSTYEDFYPELNRIVPEYEKFLTRLKTRNKLFNEQMSYLASSDIRYFALVFLSSGRTKHPDKGNITDFHRKILAEDLINDRLLDLPYAWDFVEKVSSATRRHLNNTEEHIDFMLNRMEDPKMKSMLVLKMLAKRRSAETYHSFMETYGKYLIVPEHRNTAMLQGSKYQALLPGNDAIDFSYPDIDGKVHSLSDYKGKVVVVDVWATWCGPCLKEIPFFKKLKDEFEGREVVFMGISVDKDKFKWEAYVKTENLAGIQLRGTDGIRESYQIKGIPRFMVFDKAGKIITVEAPRPSDPALKQMIENALNER